MAGLGLCNTQMAVANGAFSFLASSTAVAQLGLFPELSAIGECSTLVTELHD